MDDLFDFLGDLRPTAEYDETGEELDYDEDEDYPFEDVFGPVGGRGPAPWYGYPPRVLAFNLRSPLKPRLVLWRKGEVVEDFVMNVDLRGLGDDISRVRAVAEAFGDYCRRSGLFAAYLAARDYLNGGTPLQAAVYAAMVLEADWAGMIIARPFPPAGAGERPRLRRLAREAAAEINGGLRGR